MIPDSLTLFPEPCEAASLLIEGVAARVYASISVTSCGMHLTFVQLFARSYKIPSRITLDLFLFRNHISKLRLGVLVY